MINVVVADSHRHAKAMIGWLKLDARYWHPAAYGDKLAGRILDAMLVRPISGVDTPHVAWVVDELHPRVRGRITSTSGQWFDDAVVETPDGPTLAQFVWDA